VNEFWVFDTSTEFNLSGVEGLSTGFGFWIRENSMKKFFSVAMLELRSTQALDFEFADKYMTDALSKTP